MPTPSKTLLRTRGKKRKKAWPSIASRLRDPLEWLENNARPSWEILLHLCPCHYATEKVTPTIHSLKGAEAGSIKKLIEDYERTLPYLSEKHDEQFSVAYCRVAVAVPRRNKGRIHFRMHHDHHENSWFSTSSGKHIPQNSLDKIISWEAAQKTLTKKRPVSSRRAACLAVISRNKG